MRALAVVPVLGVAVDVQLVIPSARDWWDVLNPFSYLGTAAGAVVASGWTAAMVGLWNAGLWMLRLVLTLTDSFLTPDLSEHGPGRAAYPVTFWIAVSLVVVLTLVQLGTAAFRRDGRSLATTLVGLGQFLIVWGGWLTYGAAVIAACGGLTQALMGTLLHVDSWAQWKPWSQFSTDDITDGTVATVLGLLGLVLWVAAIGHLLVMLARAGALMVLVATAPISAAGLVGDAGRAWFWKSLRWFHAAAFTPVLMVLVLGIGVQLTTGTLTGTATSTAGDAAPSATASDAASAAANGGAGGVQAVIGTAVPGVVLILIACFAPLALFKLLAFVDPSTSSGAAMRQGLVANGGLQGLLGRGPGAATGQMSGGMSGGLSGGASGSGGAGGSAAGSAASTTDQNGRAAGESTGEDTTTQRFSGALGKLGAVGSVAAAGVGIAGSIGSRAAAIGSDVTNQMGVGSHSYQPDFTGSGSGPRRTAGTGPGPRGSSAEADHDTPSTPPGSGGSTEPGISTGDGAATVTAPLPVNPTPPTNSSPSATPATGKASAPSTGGPAAGAGGGDAAAAAAL